MRIGILCPTPDPLSPSNWSGTPAGLAEGLRAWGVEVVPIGARLPVGFHQAVAVASRVGGKRGAVADRTVVRQLSRRWAVSRSLRRAGRLDGLVAMGTEMVDLLSVRPRGVRVATYDDATLLQMWRHEDSDIRRSGFPEREVTRWCERQAASSRAADVCCTATEWAARSLVEDYNVDVDRVRVVGIGHRPRVGPDANDRDWSHPRYLFVGVDWVRKNGPEVLDAFERIRCEWPTAHLDVVGRHPPLDAPGVTGHGFLGRDDPAAQARLDALLAQATAFVLPSRFEPAGIAYLEAASAGLPVIATDQGGAAELLGPAAITVDPNDPEELLTAMRSLADPDTARHMGIEASTRSQDATWAHVASRLMDALHLPEAVQ